MGLCMSLWGSAELDEESKIPIVVSMLADLDHTYDATKATITFSVVSGCNTANASDIDEIENYLLENSSAHILRHSDDHMEDHFAGNMIAYEDDIFCPEKEIDKATPDKDGKYFMIHTDMNSGIRKFMNKNKLFTIQKLILLKQAYDHDNGGELYDDVEACELLEDLDVSIHSVSVKNRKQMKKLLSRKK